PAPTIGDEIAIEPEVLRAQEGHPEGSALSEVVDLALASGPVEPAVDALPVAEPDDAGLDLSEGRPEVRELPVGSGRARHGREPVVADQIVLRESGQGRKLLRTEAAHDARGVTAVPLVAQGKAAHGGAGGFGPGELVVDVLELVRWIYGELPLVLGAVADAEPAVALPAVGR